MQPVHLEGQLVVRLPFQPVGYKENDRALAEQRKAAVRANARCAAGLGQEQQRQQEEERLLWTRDIRFANRLAEAIPDATRWFQLYTQADAALYAAKAGGRNRCIMASVPPLSLVA